MRFAYALLTWLLAPFLVLHLLWRSRANPGYRQRIGERFGLGPELAAAGSIWVHAASVGEVQAAAPLIRRLRGRYPGTELVVTTLTPTGADRVRLLFGDDVRHGYVPFDLRGAVHRFVRRLRPTVAIIMETELWPNLYQECAVRGVPLLFASARLSPRSLRRYRWFGNLFRGIFAGRVAVAAQTSADAQRFVALGADPNATQVTGSLKFDVRPGDEVTAAGRSLRDAQAGDRPVWIAASTHDDEEQAVLDAHREVLREHPSCLLMLVPRHPERFRHVRTLLEYSGLDWVARSDRRDCDPGTQVFFGDSMGELPVFYAASDVAFVAGSLAPVGGHNLLEPAALGVPVVTGPHNFNAPEVIDLLVRHDAVQVVADAGELAVAVTRLLGDADARARLSASAQAVIEQNRGALERIVEMIGELRRGGSAAGLGDGA